MWAATTFSVLLSLAAAPANLVVPVPEGEFRFSDVHVWKYSEARGERIPAFSAEIENTTGWDWNDVRLRVRAVCGDGERAYEVHLARLRAGRQTVQETAFDAIGVVKPCDERAVQIELAGGTRAEAATFVIVGFAQEFKGSGWTTSLEGILDHRRPTEYRSATNPVYWRDGGEKLFEVAGAEPVAYYSFRVQPGEFGLAGFTLTREAHDTGPLARFLRLYMLDPGSATYLGTFRLFRGEGAEVGVRIEFDEAAYQRLSARGVNHMRIERGKPYKPLVPSSFTIGE